MPDGAVLRPDERAFLLELFPTRYRYSGAALAYSLGGVLGGALPPIIAVQLQAGLESWAIGIYIAVVAVISLGSVLAPPETREVDLDLEVGREIFANDLVRRDSRVR